MMFGEIVEGMDVVTAVVSRLHGFGCTEVQGGKYVLGSGKHLMFSE